MTPPRRTVRCGSNHPCRGGGGRAVGSGRHRSTLAIDAPLAVCKSTSERRPRSSGRYDGPQKIFKSCVGMKENRAAGEDLHTDSSCEGTDCETKEPAQTVTRVTATRAKPPAHGTDEATRRRQRTRTAAARRGPIGVGDRAAGSPGRGGGGPAVRMPADSGRCHLAAKDGGATAGAGWPRVEVNLAIAACGHGLPRLAALLATGLVPTVPRCGRTPAGSDWGVASHWLLVEDVQTPIGRNHFLAMPPPPRQTGTTRSTDPGGSKVLDRSRQRWPPWRRAGLRRRSTPPTGAIALSAVGPGVISPGDDHVQDQCRRTGTDGDVDEAEAIEPAIRSCEPVGTTSTRSAVSRCLVGTPPDAGASGSKGTMGQSRSTRSVASID